MSRVLIIVFIWMMLFPVGYAGDYYQFHSATEQQRFQILTQQLRCLVCQNQTIAESNASLANDLREQIYQRIQKGESDKSIIDYLTSRYGQFILYQPPFDAATLVLWLGPLLFFLACIIYLLFYLSKKRGS